jgi:hypothetical protein
MESKDRKVVAAIRPEFVIIEKIGGPKGAWKGKIEDRVFIGSTVRYGIRTENGDLEGTAAVIDKDFGSSLLARQIKADLFLSPDLGLMNYIQYDNVSRELGWSMRFRWRISPGNEIFIVYNKNWEKRWDPASRFFPLEERGVRRCGEDGEQQGERRAEARLREQHPETGQARTEADTRRLVHELQVHQIELQMQNDELEHARDTVEAGLEKYSDLYDFAPVGYVTLDREGTIRQVNRTGALLLGVERSGLVNRRFGQFVA